MSRIKVFLKRIIITICLFNVSLITSATNNFNCFVEFKVELDIPTNTYQVWMKPNQTYTGFDSWTSTGQVTLVIPTNSFTITNFAAENGDWMFTTQIVAPPENPGYDYLVFGLNSAGMLPYNADQEVLLFTFQNIEDCVDGMVLMETNDPFFPPNSLSLNPGNQLTVFGNGSQNAWCNNYDVDSNNCEGPCAAAAPIVTKD